MILIKNVAELLFLYLFLPIRDRKSFENFIFYTCTSEMNVPPGGWGVELASCSERRATEHVKEDGTVQKETLFVFQGFREY